MGRREHTDRRGVVIVLGIRHSPQRTLGGWAMPEHRVFSLRTPWWTQWESERRKESSPLGSAMRKLWKGKLEAICMERGLDYT